MVREVVWTRLDAPGLEYLRLLDDTPHQAHGTVVGVDQHQPFALTYLLRWDFRWHVRSVRAECRTGDRLLTLDLEATGDGEWRSGSERRTDLEGCIDVDLSVTPFTNTLPIRRLALAGEQSAEIRVVYIAVPALTAEPMGQRYTRLGSASADVYRYESLASDFKADLIVDADGLVVDYPNLWRRIVPR